jgi:ATP-binding cassette subfamily B protein
MNLFEPASAALTQKIHRRLVPGEQELIRVGSDLLADRTFGSQWVVVTGQRVLLVPSAGDDGIVDLPLRDVATARTEALIGGGCLEIALKQGPPLRVPYSASLAVQFSEVAQGIEQLCKGEPFSVRAELDRGRCERCGRQLPEKNGICPACIQRLAILRRITTYLMRYKGWMLLLVLSSLIITLAALLPPMITRRIIDDVLLPRGAPVQSFDHRFSLLGFLVLALFGLRLLSWGTEWVSGWISAWLGARVTADMRSQVYWHLEMLSLRFYDKERIGSLMSRVTNDAATLQDFLIRGLPSIVLNGLIILGVLGVIFSISWQLALYTFLPVPIMLAWGILFWGRMHRFFQERAQTWSKFSARLSEVLSGIRVVKAFAQEGREIAAFERHNTTLFRVRVRTNRNQAVSVATMSLVTSLGVMILWLLGGREVLLGHLTIGTLLAFYNYMLLFYGHLQVFGQINTSMTQAFAGAERIFEILDIPPEGYERPDAVPMPRMQGRVTFRDVTFGYDASKPVLHELDLDVAPGEMIGHSHDPPRGPAPPDRHRPPGVLPVQRHHRREHQLWPSGGAL